MIRWFSISRGAGTKKVIGWTLRSRAGGGLSDFVPRRLATNLRRVAISRVRWHEHDVVKSLFHRRTKRSADGAGKDIRSSSPSSARWSRPKIDRTFTFTEPSGNDSSTLKNRSPTRHATSRSFPNRPAICGAIRWLLAATAPLVPGATETDISVAGPNPYAHIRDRICIFAGNLYDDANQPGSESHSVFEVEPRRSSIAITRLPLLSPRPRRHVAARSRLRHDVRSGAARKSWDYLRHASVGIVVMGGTRSHNNESTKIYYYLRVGLLRWSAKPVSPNDEVSRASGIGTVVANGDLEALSDAVLRATCFLARPRVIARENLSWRATPGTSVQKCTIA